MENPIHVVISAKPWAHVIKEVVPDPPVLRATLIALTIGPLADGLVTECSVVSAAREGDEVIDAGGGTVLPGLIDAHVHLVPGALAQSLTFGVTTVLDMFSKPDLVARAKEQACCRPDVADVRSSGVGATAPGGTRR